MATPTNHWKLGLFVLVGVTLAVLAVGVLGARSLNEEVGIYVSYFDESVQGLDVGSPIKFRGVTIGAVGKIDIAPDHRHVEVTSELGKAELSRLGLDIVPGVVDPDEDKKLEQAIDLRAQLVAAGVTGVKFLQLDFFTVADHLPPELPFPVPENYIPATSSTMKDLEDSLVLAMNNLPEITEQVISILGRIDMLVDELADSRLTAQTLATLDGLRETVARTNGVLAQMEGDNGLVQSLQRATHAFGNTANTAEGLGGPFEDTLRSVQEAAQSIRKLADALEKEPDMLLKGRLVETRP